MNWIKQLFCRHELCSWETEQVTPRMTRTTGGCDTCGKQFQPPCERCGRGW